MERPDFALMVRLFPIVFDAVQMVSLEVFADHVFFVFFFVAVQTQQKARTVDYAKPTFLLAVFTQQTVRTVCSLYSADGFPRRFCRSRVPCCSLCSVHGLSNGLCRSDFSCSLSLADVLPCGLCRSHNIMFE